MIYFAFSLCLSTEPVGIFSKYYNDKIINIDTTGSSRQKINGSMQLTKPEYAIYPWKKDYDWCSNCMSSYDQHPWITFSLKNQLITFSGYFMRAGCCYEGGCCYDRRYYYCIKCCLYSWSLQISDDNKTWTEVHKITKDNEMKECAERTYKLDKEYTTKYVRLLQTENCPDDPPCIALNRFELLGDIHSDNSNDDFISFHDDDDDVSIIGHISRNKKIEVI